MENRTKPKTTILIRTEGREPKIIECDGIAFVAIEDKGDGYQKSCGVVGNLSIGELVHLHGSIQEQLTAEIKKQAISCFIESLGE